jgi:beta propeller repeat protein
MSGAGTVLALICVLAAPAAGAQTVTGVETRVTESPADQWAPSISGDLISYTDFRGQDTDIYCFDLSTGVEHPVTTAPGNQELSDVSEGLISYLDLDHRRILVFDPRAGTTLDVTAGASGTAIAPNLGQKIVAWADNRDGNLEIYARDLSTGEERRVTYSPAIDDLPAVDSGVIVWQRCTTPCDIWAYDWATGATRQITDTPDRDERQADIWHSRVVYEGLIGAERDICEFDLDSGKERRLALPADQGHPSISGDFVAFDDLTTGVYHIRLWHLPSDGVFAITGGRSGQYLNDIDGNRIVYTDDRGGQLDIYLFEFQFTAAPSLAADCEHLNGATPLLDATLAGDSCHESHFSLPFAAPQGPGLLCIDNGPGGAPKVFSGVVKLNAEGVVDPDDWWERPDWFGRGHGRLRSHLERRLHLEVANRLDVELRGRPGSTVRMRVFAAAPAPDRGCRHGHGERHRSGLEALAPASVVGEPAFESEEERAVQTSSGGALGGGGGCNQSGLVEAHVAALLALCALAHRARPRSRR